MKEVTGYIVKPNHSIWYRLGGLVDILEENPWVFYNHMLYVPNKFVITGIGKKRGKFVFSPREGYFSDEEEYVEDYKKGLLDGRRRVIKEITIEAEDISKLIENSKSFTEMKWDSAVWYGKKPYDKNIERSARNTINEVLNYVELGSVPL